MDFLQKPLRIMPFLIAAIFFLFVPSISYADEAATIMEEASYAPEERLYDGKTCVLTAEWVVISSAALHEHFQEPYINWWYHKALSSEELSWIKNHASLDHAMTLQTKIGALTKYTTDYGELSGIMYARQHHMDEAFISFHSVLLDQIENISCILHPGISTIVQSVDSPDKQTKSLLIMCFYVNSR